MSQPKEEAIAVLRHFGAVGDGLVDDTSAVERYIENLSAHGGGTLFASDGVYGLSRTIVLPQGVSLQLMPGATLLALPGFKGEAVVQTGVGDASTGEEDYADTVIHGGIIDGNRQPLVGLRIRKGARVHVGDLLVRDCLAKGIHVGVYKGYEVNFDNVRCLVTQGIKAIPGSIGFHIDKTTDCLVSELVVIGYETSVRSDSAANDFNLAHVWNYGNNCALKTCFHCNGHNDSYTQCYADGPFVAAGERGYGFYVERPHTRIIGCRLYCSHFSPPDVMVGIYIAPTGTGGAYIGNHFMTRGPGHEMLAAFDGHLEGATFLANTYSDHIRGGQIAGLR